MFSLLSDLTGVPVDQVSTFLILIVISPVLGYVSSRLVPEKGRPWFNIGVGVWFLQLVVGWA